MIAAAACLLFVAILVLLFLHTPRDMGYRDSMDIENQKLAAESIFSADELDVKFERHKHYYDCSKCDKCYYNY